MLLQPVMHTALLTIYTATMVSLVWARLRFFELKSESSVRVAWLYDPLAGLHVVTSYYFFVVSIPISTAKAMLAISILIVSEWLFVATLIFAKQLNFAQSSELFKLLQNGPFAVIRHPLYLSYSLIWISTTLIFNSLLLWITLGSLIAFYIFSAKREEEAILQSRYSREYMDYKKRVGMFLPRISQWKSWILELLAQLKS